ncbi:SusC/RagA family TonB-linked outer membrane protein [Chitinophaga rhizophila]|uniref:TonB-dependent receptor n=1 Tax=Chitinophaga rhizophila TaxID=2866212 RepID=A0ABS7G7X3_9BACT|nr:TonB-dependent receptor [Chitinophaga rhizophila]MBW8683763.1 TonB-dependent receptor [Chitinophaga rhizophila]
MQKCARWLSCRSGRPFIPDYCLKSAVSNRFRRNRAALLTVVLLLMIQGATYAQSISLSGKNMTLKAVFTEVEKQTGYVVFGKEALLAKTKPVSVAAVKMPLGSFLDVVLKDQQIAYKIESKTIVLSQVMEDNNRTETVDAESAISGIVVNKNGEKMSGVSILLKGQAKTIVTNEAGAFTVNAKPGDILIFRYVGYETKELTIKRDLPLSVMLEQNVSSLSEAVVVGYGVVKRKDLTGAVASVNQEEVKNIPFTSLDQALVGKAAGVQVIQSDGSPGGATRMRIRGGASLMGNNDPLYIIDGVPVTIQNRYVQNAAEIVNPVETYSNNNFNSSVSGSFSRGLNSLAGLNINDIETIDILKDASATAIYGSKAANGVVIITTKRGSRNQKPQLEGNYYAGMSVPLKEKVLNAEQYKMIFREGAMNLNNERARLGMTPNETATSILNNPNYFGTADTDWLGLVLRTGFTHNADVSVRGGGTGSRYYTSIAYTRQDGVLIGTDFNRIAGKISLDNEINSKLKVISNLDYGFSTNNITNGIYSQALYAPPTEKVYNEDGSFSNMGNISTAYQGFQNPLAVASGINRAKNVSLLGSLALEYDILKDLKFRSVVSINYSNYHQLNYVPSYVDIGSFYGRESSGGGTGSQSYSNSINSFFENTVTWNKVFNENNRLNMVAGTSWEKFRASMFSATGRGYPEDKFLNNLNSAAVPVSVRGSDPSSQNSLLSFYVRANYALYDKYLFTFTGRSDASSKFGPGNHVGYFPSGAVAWRISDEAFLKHVKWIDEIKLRVSAGLTGTQSIADHLWRTLYTPVAYAGNNALIPSQLGNQAIKWESTLQKDLGLDFAFFNSHIRGTFGYYEKVTDGLLLNISTAPSSAYSNMIVNLAKIRNRGLEFDIRTDILQKRNVKWNVALNISRNVSDVLNIDGGPFSDPNQRDALNLGTGIVQEGRPLGQLYGRVSKGVIKTQKQLEDYKAAFPYWEIFSPYLNIGDLAYEIEDGFWKNDIIGHSYPSFYGGLTNTVNYKNFSLIALLTFSYGNQLILQNDVSSLSVDNLANRSTRILDHYSATNTASDRPRLLYNETNFLSNNSVFDASYLKLKSLTISYNVPQAITRRMNFRDLSFYVSGTNLFIVSKYPGLDPEVSDDPMSVIGGGRDISSYPTNRMFIAGLRFGL